MTDDDVILKRQRTASRSSGRRGVLTALYAGAVVVAALYFGRELIVPLVLASFLAFVLAPACALLQRIRLPRVAAVTVVVLMAFGIMGGLGTIVGRQAAALAGNLPSYQSTVMQKWEAIGQGDSLLHRLIRAATQSSGGAKPGTDASKDNPASILGLSELSNFAIAKTVAQPVLGQIETGGIVLVFTIFILLASADLKDRLVRLVGRHDLHRTILAMNDAAGRLSQYFLFQLGLNVSFGTLIGIALWFAGLPNPLLWGILAALMRFVPYIGVFIALAPPLLLAIAVVPGWTLAISVLAMFLVAEAVMGQVIEPLIYGHRTGLSPLAIIVATAFWALLWGPIGLLLATPLTVCLVVIGRHVEALAFFDVLLGDSPPLAPYETFYQRALEGQAMALAPDARKRIAATSLTEYYDKVALPGLALAQDDLVSDALAFERLEAIHGQIDVLIQNLAETTSRAEKRGATPPTLSSEWRADSILCIPGRGQLDGLAATMAVQALTAAGFGAKEDSNLVLAPTSAADLSGIRLCCLSVLEEGSSVSGIRYFIRRIQKRMPSALIVVGLWHADRDSNLLAELRAENHNEHLVLSISELVTFAIAIAARGPRPDQVSALTAQEATAG